MLKLFCIKNEPVHDTELVQEADVLYPNRRLRKQRTAACASIGEGRIGGVLGDRGV
jgi:hypothetical protein